MFTGIQQAQKNKLIRLLVGERVRESFFGRLFGSVDTLGPHELLGTPEGTAVSIVETYFVLSEQGMDSDTILRSIEDHRQLAGHIFLYKGMDLHSYIYHRIRVEHKRGARLTDRDVDRIVFITTKFIRDFYLTDHHQVQEEQETEESDNDDDLKNDTNNESELADDIVEDNIGESSQVFMSQMPHPEKNIPVARYRYQSYFIEYYEQPITIGEILGIRAPFKFPQLAVVRKNEIPVCIVRIEEGLIGTAVLGALFPSGVHSNYGTFSKSDRNSFLKKVAEVLKDSESV